MLISLLRAHDGVLTDHPELRMICDEHADDLDDMIEFYRLVEGGVDTLVPNPNVNISRVSGKNQRETDSLSQVSFSALAEPESAKNSTPQASSNENSSCPSPAAATAASTKLKAIENVPVLEAQEAAVAEKVTKKEAPEEDPNAAPVEMVVEEDPDALVIQHALSECESENSSLDIKREPLTPSKRRKREEEDEDYVPMPVSAPPARRRGGNNRGSRPTARHSLDGKVTVRKTSPGSPARKQAVTYVGGNAPKYHCKCEEDGCAWKGRKSRFLDHLVRKHRLPEEVAKEKVVILSLR